MAASDPLGSFVRDAFTFLMTPSRYSLHPTDMPLVSYLLRTSDALSMYKAQAGLAKFSCFSCHHRIHTPYVLTALIFDERLQSSS